MEIVKELRAIPNLSLALGFFDGMHLGHQMVIDGAINFARENNIKSAVITFKQHPKCHLNNVAPRYIFTKEDKYNIMNKMGIDYIIELDFPSLCKMSAEEYLEYIVKYFSPRAISTGFNHHFGANRQGDVFLLNENQTKYNYIFFATPPQTIYGDIISSSEIRRFISQGSIPMANDMLGQKFSVKGKVIEGKKLGREIGFPTANIEYPKEIIEPPFGVYKVEVRLENGENYLAIGNYGNNPTVSNSKAKILEVHIPNFSQDLYGKNIKIKFLKQIREEIKFNSVEELKAQIVLDIQKLNY